MAARAAWPDLTPGATFPGFELTDHTGRTRSLADLAGGDPVVLCFARGWWCPKEQRFQRELLSLQDELEVAYARIVTVTVDAPEVNAAFRAGLGARWTFLSDPDRRVQGELGLRETTDTTHDPYRPAQFVLAPDATIESAYNGYWYAGRASREELRRDLRAVARRIRADWELDRA